MGPIGSLYLLCDDSPNGPEALYAPPDRVEGYDLYYNPARTGVYVAKRYPGSVNTHVYVYVKSEDHTNRLIRDPATSFLNAHSSGC